MCTAAQQGALPRCLNLSDAPGRQAPSSLLQGGNWTRKLGRRVRNLGGRQVHRHGSLPSTLSRARAGVRLQPAPAAAPKGQPYYPDSSRLVLHSCSGSMRIGPLDRFSTVLAPTRNQDTVLRNKYARMIKTSCHNTFLSPQQPSPSSTEPERSGPADHCHAMERSWTADAFCRLDSGLTPQYDRELGLGPPEVLIPRTEESSEEDKPFLLRFLLQAIIFARLFPNRPSLQGNLLCTSDWLRLRGISATERMILPIRDLAAFPHCCVCEQLKAVERSSARWPLSAPVLLSDSRRRPDQVPWYGSLGRADSPCSGRTDSIYDSEPDLWKWDLDTTGDCCPRAPRPVPQSAVQFRPRLLLRELLLAHSPSDPRRSIRGSPLTKSDWLSLKGVAHTECATTTFQATVNY